MADTESDPPEELVEAVADRVEKRLGSDTIQASEYSRREIVEGIAALGTGAAVGGLSTYGAVGRASASHGGGSIGTANDPVDVFANAVDAENFNNVEWLTADLSESEVRSRIEGLGVNDVGIIEPGASWDVTGTVKTDSATLVHYQKRQSTSAEYTFKKAFNGDLLRIDDWGELYNIKLEGNKSSYSGNGIVDNSDGTRNTVVQFVEVQRVDGVGYLSRGHYDSVFIGLECRNCDSHGYQIGGTVHHSKNTYINCHMSGNGGSGVYFSNRDEQSTWINCFFDTNYAAFEHDTTEGTDNIVIDSCTLTSQDNCAWLHRQGGTSHITFRNCEIESNQQSVDTNLTTPIGDAVQVEGTDRVHFTFYNPKQGNIPSNGVFFKNTVTGTSSFLGLYGQSIGNQIVGDIQASGTRVTCVNTGAFSAIEGSDSANVKTLLGLDPTGKVVDVNNNDRYSNRGTRLGQTTGQSVSSSTSVTAAWDNTDYDDLGGADLTNNQISVPESGKYEVEAQISWAAGIGAGTHLRIGIEINGSRERLRIVTTGADDVYGIYIADKLSLNASDNVSISIRQQSGSSQTTRGSGAECYFNVHRVGQ